MTQTPIPHCDCCGLPISPQFGEDCPRCNYPINPSKEERFLASAIYDLQRVITYGGANLTVAGLLRRYQGRLDYLYRLKVVGVPATPSVTPVTKPVAPVPHVVSHAESAPASPPVGSPPVATPGREEPGLRQWFLSLRSFAIDQAITILGILGAFFVLLAGLSFVINPAGIALLAFLVAASIHVVFGVASIVVRRFPALHVLSIIYTVIYALTVPLLGYTAYNLVQGHILRLSVPELVAIAAAYAAAVYIALAIYQCAALFGYLGVMAIVVVDLAIVRDLGLGYWWWPSMLMLLALPALVTHLQPAGEASLPIRRLFTSPRAVLYEPVRILMFMLVATCALGLVVTILYSLGLDTVNSQNSEVRFSILSMTALLLLWIALSLWLTKRTREVPVLAYQFLGCVLAFCYAFNFRAVGYVLALMIVALLYHGLNRFATRLLQPFGKLVQHLDLLALILVGIVPVISAPLLPQQLLSRVYSASSGGISFLHFQAGWETVAELIAISAGVLLTISVIFNHTSTSNRSGMTGTQQSAWPWLLLLSGFVFNWGYGMLVLAVNLEPAWCFFGLTLVLVAGAVVVRRVFGGSWASPLDVLALVEAILTISLSLNQRSEIIGALMLFFAALSYTVLLYQRRSAWLCLPVIFAVVALFFVQNQVTFLMGVLLPVAAVVVHRLLRTNLVASKIGSSTNRQFTLGWEWPLLAVGLLSGVVISALDVAASESTVHSWLGVTFPVALEMAVFALVWYVAAGLAQIKWWLLAVIGFASAALLLPSNSFWVLVWLAPVPALLAFGISSLADRDWASPLYIVALLGAVMMGIRGYEQDQLFATAWALLGFAILIYIIGITEDLALFIWVAPVFATWSVFDSGLQGDLYRPPMVALICVALAVATRLLSFHAPSIFRFRHNRVTRYILPFYATAVAAAVLTGIYGMLGDINKPFYGAIPDALLIYAGVAYAVLLFEQRLNWLWLAAGFAVWGTLVAIRMNAYYVVGIGIGAGLVGLLLNRLIHLPGLSTVRSAFGSNLARFTLAWPWYITALVAALVTGAWTSISLNPPVSGFIGYGLLAFTLLAVLIMLVERTPEMLVFPVALAAWTIWQWGAPPLDIVPLMIASSLLCVLIFVSQFAWKIIPPATNWLPATALHRIFGLGGQILVVLVIVQQNGLSADSGALVHVGAGALFVLALLLSWDGRLQNNAALRHYCYYGAGLLLSLVVPWELLAFRQTNMSLLALVPASYLIVIAPFLGHDETLPAHHRVGQIVSILGAALLLLPTVWLSFGEDNLGPTLILAGEAVALLLLGVGSRVRIFVLAGTGLVVLAGLRALFLQTQSITWWALILGLVFLVVATGLALARHRLQAAWNRWQ